MILTRLFRLLYARHRLRGAQLDHKYWEEEVRRTQANSEIAANRVAYWVQREYDALYPLKKPRPIKRAKLGAYYRRRPRWLS